jgi:hypothetical protein
MTTNVPPITLTPVGFAAPTEPEILAGVQADQLAAFGGDLNTDLTTPQGQLATSETAIIGDKNAQLLALFNGIDPPFATGRLQDAIGRIYFLTRIAAQSTVVTATCSGLAGTVIPIGAQAKDQAGRIYVATSTGTIPVGGTLAVTFACAVTGPIAAPIGYVNSIYQAIPGWDSVTNATAGVLGRNVESAADFELRRELSVSINGKNSLQSILGAVLAVPGVIDAYADENSTGADSGATFTASISGGIMDVSFVASGTISLNNLVGGSGVAAGTSVVGFGTGSGGTGTYTVNVPQTLTSRTMTASTGGVVLVPRSIYVAVYGGDVNAVARAIWTKKSLGCDYNGSTTVTVTDSEGYAIPYPTYAVKFQVATPTPLLFAVSMQANAQVPSDGAQRVQNAILAAFNGDDGGGRARIGSTQFASRYVAGVVSLGPWARIYSILLGTVTPTLQSVPISWDRIPTLTASDISVTFT